MDEERRRKVKTSQKQIGDGKFPNKYWVFQYDQKYKKARQEDGSIFLDLIKEDTSKNSHYLGVFKTYREALECVDNKAYLPNVVIEDRISGQIFEQMCIVCQECGKEEWESFPQVDFTKKKMEENGYEFK